MAEVLGGIPIGGFLLWTGYITVARVPPESVDEEKKEENKQ